jgi:tRNA(fMet)-specific endonuclease VapC
MSFLLDTNICSEHLRRPAGLMHRFVQHSGRLSISTVVLAELHAWVWFSSDPQRYLLRLDRDLLGDIEVIPFDEAAAEEFGRLRVILRRQGTEVSAIDLQIAAVALSRDLTVVTHNVKDFAVIPGLRVEDWISA